MTNLNNLQFWVEQDEAPEMPPMSGNVAPAGGDEPQGPAEPQEMPSPMDQSPDVDDPTVPDTDEDGATDSSNDFNTWRTEFFDMAIKGDTNEMIDAIGQIRDRNLNAAQRRFVEDNFQILLLRQDANFEKASKEIRKLINQELDRNNPAVSLIQHIKNTLVNYPVINDIFVKLAGEGALKGELHRRLIAALLGAVQTGGGSEREDLIYCARDYTIDVSTRYYTKFGDITIGQWMLQQDDAEEYLSEPELERLQEGSPEEKRVHRRRVCLESIASKYSKRAFIIHILEPDNGTLHSFGWDLSDALRAGYQEGRLVVRKNKTRFHDAMIDDNGAIIPLFAYAINYKKETGEMSDEGEPETIEVSFVEQRDSILFLSANLDTLTDVVNGLPGMWYGSDPYQGNPSDLPKLMRCIPSTVEILMRRC